MWWLWIVLIVYLGIGIGVSIKLVFLEEDEDGGLIEFIACTIIMPMPATAIAIYESIKWIHDNGILRLISWVKDEFKEYLDPEERKWRKWKKQYYVRQEQERRSQEAR